MDTKNYFQLLSQLIKLNSNKIIWVEDFVDEEIMDFYPIIRTFDQDSLVWPEGLDSKIPSNISPAQVQEFILQQYTPAMLSLFKYHIKNYYK